MKWQDHLEQLNRDDEEYEALQSFKKSELEELEDMKNEYPEEYQAK